MSNKQNGRLLTVREYSGLCKVGDLIAPGYQQFPKFSITSLVSHVDFLLLNMAQKDFMLFKRVCLVFSILPSFVISLFFKCMFLGSYIPGPFGALFRKFVFGFKMVIYSLYYSELNVQGNGASLLESIGYTAVCHPISDVSPFTCNLQNNLPVAKDESKNYEPRQESDENAEVFVT